MDQFINDEISKLHGKIDQLKQIQEDIRNEKYALEKVYKINDVKKVLERSDDEKKKLESVKAATWAQCLNNMDQVSHFSRYPFILKDCMEYKSKMIDECGDLLCHSWTGRWIVVYLNVESIADSIPENIPDHYDRNSYYRPHIHYLMTPAVIIKFISKEDISGAVIRYYDLNYKVCEMEIWEWDVVDPKTKNRTSSIYFDVVFYDKLLKWLFRHTFAKIRGHIRRWREHLKYKPGAQGYKRCRKEFENLAQHHG